MVAAAAATVSLWMPCTSSLGVAAASGPPSSSFKGRPLPAQPLSTTVQVWPSHACSCQQQPQQQVEHGTVSRRRSFLLTAATVAAAAVPALLSAPEGRCAEQGTKRPRGLSQYIKKRQKDPIETYVPTVLLARGQLLAVEEALQLETPAYTAARSLLKEGSAATLRTDLRALAEYAAEADISSSAPKTAESCLSSLERLDIQLLTAARSIAPALDDMKANLMDAVAKLDIILATVPTNVLSDAKAAVAQFEAERAKRLASLTRAQEPTAAEKQDASKLFERRKFNDKGSEEDFF
eukprot:jgi/Chlat1/497/Chrsp103S01096